MSTRKSKRQVAVERTLKTDEMLKREIKHLIIAELYDAEIREKIHDKSLDHTVTYMLKCEALMKVARAKGIMVEEIDELLKERPEIEGKIITDCRVMSKEELDAYNSSTSALREKIWKIKHAGNAPKLNTLANFTETKNQKTDS